MKDYGRTFPTGAAAGKVLTSDADGNATWGASGAMGTDGIFNSVKITGDYGTAGTDGLSVNIYFGTAATMGTTGVADGALYFTYTV